MHSTVSEVFLFVQELLDEFYGDLVQLHLAEERVKVQAQGACIAPGSSVLQCCCLVGLIPLLRIFLEGRTIGWLRRDGIIHEFARHVVLEVNADNTVVELVYAVSGCPFVDGLAGLVNANAHALPESLIHIRNSFQLGFQSVLWSSLVVFKEREQGSVLFHQLVQIIEGFRGDVNLGQRLITGAILSSRHTFSFHSSYSGKE